MSMRTSKHRRIERLVMESFPDCVITSGFCNGFFEVEIRRRAPDPAWAAGEILLSFAIRV